ncbi:hypothetical protein D3C71_1773770 [compost metagenome]
MQFNALFGGGVQVAGPCVIAKPGPVGHHRVVVGFGQIDQRREHLHEAQEVGDDRDHLGLLQHDFRQPYPVRRTRMLPGQIVAAVLVEPGEELAGEVGHWLAKAGDCSCSASFSLWEKVPPRGG